ncbi:MAG: serine hydrolase domain-containing protein, partial [Myxococcota bacterium]
GKLDLDEPLSAYWVDPDVAEDPRHQALTPRIMLSHRSGFPNWRQGKLEFRSDPGKASGYSGEGFEYLARFLERKFRRSIDALVTEEVFRPLSMAHTHMVADPATREKLAYARDAEGQTRPADARDTASAADDLLTRADDYGRFVAAVMRGDGLNAPLARERFHVTVPQMEGRCPWNVECPKSVGFALGWAVFDYGDERVMVQGGGDWGERALAIFVPERDLAVVVLTNGFGGGAVIRRVVETLYDNPRFHRFLAFQSKG